MLFKGQDNAKYRVFVCPSVSIVRDVSIRKTSSDLIYWHLYLYSTFFSSLVFSKDHQRRWSSSLAFVVVLKFRKDGYQSRGSLFLVSVSLSSQHEILVRPPADDTSNTHHMHENANFLKNKWAGILSFLNISSESCRPCSSGCFVLVVVNSQVASRVPSSWCPVSLSWVTEHPSFFLTVSWLLTLLSWKSFFEKISVGVIISRWWRGRLFRSHRFLDEVSAGSETRFPPGLERDFLEKEVKNESILSLFEANEVQNKMRAEEEVSWEEPLDFAVQFLFRSFSSEVPLQASTFFFLVCEN